MTPSSLSDKISAETLKQDLNDLAQETAAAARRHVVEPARDATKRVNEAAQAAYHDAKARMAGPMAEAERMAQEQKERAATWISANPFAAIGAAFGLGLLFYALTGGRQPHRR